ncbi:MAG: TIGR03915 family putative DNA repair protein [Treponema sp.]|jgi:probable DNA metabolism protein|nr:TIGR03915 family putative DNA repair protein [Treponema sp.]
MTEVCYNGSFAGFLRLFKEAVLTGAAPDRVRREGPVTLFDGDTDDGGFFVGFRTRFPEAADAVLHAWLSEFPIEPDILAYGAAVQRDPAAGADRGCAPAATVLEAAYKTAHETDRLRGFLRFAPSRSPGTDGVWLARCAPDHLALPCLAPHFSARFGASPWAVIDEKRALCLSRLGGEDAILRPLEESPFAEKPPPQEPGADPWEAIWCRYHRAITNETRRNPRLQRSFLPLRYWHYLPEMQAR